jgi:hypothetical protein
VSGSGIANRGFRRVRERRGRDHAKKTRAPTEESRLDALEQLPVEDGEKVGESVERELGS